MISRRAFFVLLACFLTLLISYAIRYSYGVILPEMLPSLGITKTEAGIISASYFIAYSIVSPILGILSDRFSVRLLVAAFVALLGAGAILMPFSASVLQSSLFFALAGIGAAACWTPIVTLAQRWSSDRRRGVVLAAIDVGSSTGIIASGTVLPMVVLASDWKMGWISLGITAVVLGLLDYVLIRDRPVAEKTIIRVVDTGWRPQTPLRVTYVRLLRNRQFWLIGMAYLLTGFSIIIPFTFLSTYAVQERDYLFETAGLLMMVIGISAMVGKLLMGPFSDRVGRIRVMLLCALLITVGNIGIIIEKGTTVLVFCTVIFGWGYGSVWSLYAAAASDYFGKEVSGSVVGLWTFLLGIGCLVSPIIAGWLADVTGTLAWAFVLAMAGGLVSLLLLIAVWRRLSPRLPTRQVAAR